jgi:hypothetical protein
MSTTQEIAVDAIEAAEAAGNVAAAMVVFAALDANRDVLTPFDRHDFALATWQRLVDNADMKFTSEHIVQLAAAVAGHVPDHTFLDLIDAQFGDAPREIRLPSGAGLDWDPEHRHADLYWPVLGQIVVHNYGRRR